MVAAHFRQRRDAVGKRPAHGCFVFVFSLFPRRKHTDIDPRVEPVLQSLPEEAIRLKPPSRSYQNIDHHPTPLGQNS